MFFDFCPYSTSIDPIFRGPNRQQIANKKIRRATLASLAAARAAPAVAPTLPEDRAASAMERKRWGECFADIMDNVKELNGLRNAFTGEPLAFIAKCEPKDRSTNGNMVLEKIVPTPPGSAIPTVASQMVDMDAIDTKTSMKLTVCDKGGYPIKIDEFEF